MQWVATEWRAAPDGDRLKEHAYTGNERIAINPAFFQRLDEKAVALNRAGLLNVPVLLWAIGSGSNPKVNPGFGLPESQAIRLAQYMVARWQGYDVAWILPGDGDYRGERAEKWKRIGRGVFGQVPHAPVMLHPGGMHWVLQEFLNEPWIDVHGYQSGHGDDEKTLRWITEGPPSTDWKIEPRPSVHQPRTAVRASPRVSVEAADSAGVRPARDLLEPAQRAGGGHVLWRTRCVGVG